jgi:4-amino-4-deoxy-L-arabinose transferase-like glycosyltransferase
LLASLAGRIFTARRALIVALIAGLATILWPYARVLFAESVLAFTLTAAALIIVREFRPGQPKGSLLQKKGGSAVGAYCNTPLPKQRVSSPILFAGMVFGLGVLTRAAFLIYILPLVVLVVRTSPGQGKRDRLIRAVFFAVGIAPFVIILLWHNWIRFDDPFQSGYGEEGFTTPILEGVLGLLFSPGKSIFLYSPPLILSLILWPRFRRDHPVVGDFLALAWIVALGFYGTWWAWHGGWSWGPRLLVPLIPLSCLPLGCLPDQRGWRIAAAVVIGLGIGVQFLGVLTDVVPHYAEIVGEDESNYAQVNFAPRHSPLVGAISRLAHGQTEPLAMFHLKDTGLPPTWTVGVPLLLLVGLVSGVGYAICKPFRNAAK